MKHRWSLALLFLIGCVTGGVAAQLVVPPVRAGTSPTGWEYACTSVELAWPNAAVLARTAQATLNKLGAEGWELVSVAPVKSENQVLCAKRAMP